MTGQAQGQSTDLALHTLGWKAFQDLCSQVCAEVLHTTVSIYREAQDGGQDAVFLIKPKTVNAAGGRFSEATVQCKFSSHPSQRLRVSDIEGELENVRSLVADGRASTYFFITSRGVDAPVAAQIRDQLTELGVQQPEVLGREWLTQQIRQSSRLRALVPRVYGLGDLSIILDERRAEQTRVLLGHMMAGLSVYVPTAAHREAVRVLTDEGIVLLLGSPATGKSMLAAILATTALDGEGHECFQLDGPAELGGYWNPHERNRLFWVDDAFGPNQLRTDYVDMWIANMNKVKAAITGGNRFILTSRTHIWNAAKLKLGTRNHPLLRTEKAVVNVGALSPEERAQILYNHIKAGNQSRRWKETIKSHLAYAANEPALLPEIARRLADSNYTTKITDLPEDLVRFVSEPMAFLQETIRELADPHRAALTLVFLSRSRLSAATIHTAETTLVADKFGVSVGAITEALSDLEGSFLSLRTDANGTHWRFVHPTISDALASILAKRPDLVELYIRGAKAESILSDVVCEGAKPIRDAVVVPATLNDLLINRLLGLPDSLEINHALFQFLNERSSDSILRALLQQEPDILNRTAPISWPIRRNARIALMARVHNLRMLPQSLREDAADDLEAAVLDRTDASFLEDEDILSLLAPTRLIRLSSRLKNLVSDDLSDSITELLDNAEGGADPDDTFYDVRSLVSRLQRIFSDEDPIQDQLKMLDEQIDRSSTELSERPAESSSDESWFQVAPAKVTTSSDSGRSVFSDVDR